MKGGVYQTGSSFGMNSYYRPPQIVGTINCFSTRTNGVITPTDAQILSKQTSAVIDLVKNSSFDQLVNNIQDLKYIDYNQNAKPVSIQGTSTLLLSGTTRASLATIDTTQTPIATIDTTQTVTIDTTQSLPTNTTQTPTIGTTQSSITLAGPTGATQTSGSSGAPGT